MDGKCLLDTNIIVALFKGDATVSDRVAAAAEILIASTVAGELYYGAYHSARVGPNLARVDAFVAGNTILPCDAATARQYGAIRQELAARGSPIPENDIWIAALARQHDLTLASRDGHFANVGSLRFEPW